MKLKLMNLEQRCPNCKKFGMEEKHYQPDYCIEGDGHLIKKGKADINFYRCRYCYAEYEVIK